MTWVKLDDGFADHPKLLSVSLAARWAYIEALCFAARHRTKGYLRPAVAARIAPPRVIAELVAAGLWEVNGDGWLIHDWADYQLDDQHRRELAAERQRRRRAGGAQP